MKSIEQRALEWATSNDTGLSSTAICRHMTTGNCAGDYPVDIGDFGRCKRLIDLIPEWRERMPEMAKYGRGWLVMAKRWDELTAAYGDGKNRPKFFPLIQKVIADGYREDPNYECKFGKDGSLQSWSRKGGGYSGIRLGNSTIEFGR